mmetsp:Transcript_14699/g.57667  ORF Transcript_14699/g.57667 Transcript_14699/m.57667 type:complete len:552 (+) Transcript_14699:22-1677(+)
MVEGKVDRRGLVVLAAFVFILVLSAIIVSVTFSLSLLVAPSPTTGDSDTSGIVEPWSTVLDSWDGDVEDEMDGGTGEETTGRFLVLSDIHLDPAYTPLKGGKRFCRDESKHGPSEACYTSRFDYDDDANYEYGQFGCDSPLPLLTNCLEAMRAVDADPDFLLIGGDLAMHCSPSYEATMSTVANATAVISANYRNTMIIPTIGNNDVYPEDQIAYGPSQQLSDLADIWGPWIGDEEALETFRKNGYFSVSPVEGLRVVSLNTLYYTENWCPRNDTICTDEELDSLVREDDPNGQFAWLAEQLADAVANGQDVLMTGHMSPGRTRGFNKNWRGQYQDPFLQLVERYHEHIVGAVFGHIHRDGFMMLEVEEQGAPVNLNTFLVNSALSPREKQNPAFRVVQYRRRVAAARQEHGTNSRVTLDSFSVQYLNLTNVFDSERGTIPVWEFEYNFADAYGAGRRGEPNSLLPASVQQVVHDIFEDGTSYEEYLKHWATLSDNVTIKHSKAEYLCSLIAISNSAYNDCVDLLDALGDGGETAESSVYEETSSSYEGER